MDLRDLEKLVAEGESETLEFKRSLGQLREGMQALCGFLNACGGTVLFGVADDKRVLGQTIADRTLQEVAKELQKFEPPITAKQTRFRVKDGAEVLGIEVSPDKPGPFQYDGRSWKRVGTTTQQMAVAEYEQRLLARMNSKDRWENQIAEDYSLEHLDLAEIQKTHNVAVAENRLDASFSSEVDTLNRFQLLQDEKILRAAVVLFAKEVMPDYPQCEIRMARFRGTTKDEFIDQRQVRGHAFKLLEEASIFLDRHIPVAGWFEEGKLERQNRPEYPFPALREAMVNALCHRDYTIPGGAIHIAIYDDRLEIISTGLLPAGITVEDLKRDHPSRPRNPLIAEPFFRRSLIEKWGRGTQKIVQACVSEGYPEPVFLEQAGALYVRFPAGAYAPPTQVSHDLTDRQREILQILSDGRKWTFGEIYRALDKPPAKRTARDDLILLRTIGLIDSAGHAKGSRWWLKGLD